LFSVTASSKFKQIFFKNQVFRRYQLTGDFLSVRMSPAVLKTRLLGTVLVGHPIKHQRQPLAGRVIQVENIDRFLFAYFCEASKV